jgi:hypothetical protein
MLEYKLFPEGRRKKLPSPEPAGQKDDQADQQDQSHSTTTVNGTAPIKPAAAEQEEKNDQDE